MFGGGHDIEDRTEEPNFNASVLLGKNEYNLDSAAQNGI
jgi:hypothetical protein